MPSTAVETAGTKFSIKIDPATVPTEYLNDDGRLDISIRIDNVIQRVTGSTFATVALYTDPNSGISKWIDPLNPVAEGEPASSDSNLSPADVRVTLSPAIGALPTYKEGATVQSSCPGDWVYIKSSDRQVSIAHTYVPDNTSSTAWAQHGTERNLKEGVAFRANYQGSGWQEEGTRTFASGTKMVWNSNQANTKTYRVNTRYGNYKWVGSDCWVYEYMWKPRYNVGTYTSWSGTSDPSWTGSCGVNDPGTWYRNFSSGSSYTHSGGVIISDIIGFNMYSERGYYSDSYIAYKIAGKKRLCGYDRVPEYAKHVRLRHL